MTPNDSGWAIKRAPRGEGWTVQQRAAFCDALAATCNVTAAARAAGVSVTSARRLKERDGRFAHLWAQAFALGEERLREDLIARAMGQVPTDEYPDVGRDPAHAPFDAALALQVLRMRGTWSDRSHGKPHYPHQHEVDALLLQRLAALAKRREQRLADGGDDASEHDA